MPSFNVTVPHGYESSVAAARLRSFSDKVRGATAVQVTELVEVWDESGNLEFSFKAMGFKISGKMETRISEVHVSGSIPFAALPFRGMIEKEVATKLREALA